MLKCALNTKYQGTLLALIAIFLLGMRGVVVKLSYAAGISVEDLVYFRFLFALPFMWLFAFYVASNEITLNNIKTALIPSLLAGFFGYYAATMLDFYSLTFIEAGINRVIIYTFPVYVIALNALISRSMPHKEVIFTLICVEIAIFIMLGNGKLNLQDEYTQIGIGLAFLSSISFALYLLINQASGKKMNATLFTTYSVSASFFFINLHFFIFGNSFGVQEISWQGYGYIAYLAIFGTVIPLLLTTKAIQLISASRFSMLSTLGPVLTILSATIILGERLSLIQWLCVFVIIALLYYIEKKQIKQKNGA